LSLARTLLHEPPVLLLDEPTSAMDPESSRLVRQAITGLRSDNRTIIICTHNLVEAEMLADRIAIIYRGRILTQGTVEELKINLLGPTEYLVRMRGEWRIAIHDLPPGVVFVCETEAGPRFKIEDPEVGNPILLKQLINSGLDIVSMQEVSRSLEDVYLAAMAKVTHV
jgi:ABC-2 type transport system ATP-binding protein